MPRLAILSLGALHITMDDMPISDFNSDKARALLVYLSLESHRAHRRESLAGLLWPEFPDQRARHTLSQVLYNIRQVIGDRDSGQTSPFLDITRQTIRFNRTSDYWLDVELFAKPLEFMEPHQVLSSYEQAIGAYRGLFLEGLYIDADSAFEEWVLMQRERWQHVAADTTKKLIEGYTRLGDYDKALQYAWRQLDLDSWREDAHCQVMHLLALSGQRTAALAQYNTCRRTLWDELGVEPEAETTSLYETIKTGNFASPHAPTSERLKAPTPPTNLPVQITPLVGRDAELTSLRTRLQDPMCRLITLVGSGGIGKTRLALETIKPFVSRYTHGVFFVALAPIQFVQAIVPTIAQTLGFTFSDKGGSQAQQLLAYLKNKTLLLLLDNAEHLLQERGTESSITDAITAILETAPDVQILVTSRTRLNALGEHLFPVRELAYPEATAEQLDDVQHFAAVQLFIQSARRLRPDFTLAENNVRTVSTICRCVQGNPLAILLTATWTTTLSTADIAARLTGESAGLDLLQTDWHNVPPRHRSLRAVFEQSWRLLAEHERNVMRALSIFRGGFTADAALAVAGAVPHNLRILVNASFLRREFSGRYIIHDLLRQFAAEKLALDRVALHNVRERHCAYFVEALQRWGEESKGPRQQDVLAEMDSTIGDARVALDWTVIQGDIAHIEQAIQGLCLFYQRRIRRQEGAAACQAAAERLEALGDSPTPLASERLRVLSKVLTWHSRFLNREQAYVVIKRTLALLECPELASQDGPQSLENLMVAEKAAALHQMGHIMMGKDREKAKQLYGQSLGLYRTINSSWEESQVLDSLGWLGWHTGEYKSARQYHEKSLSISQTLGDLRGMAWSIQGLSGVAMSLGQVEESARLSQESLALRRETGDLLEIADGLYSLAFKYIALGRSIDAVPLLEECKNLTCDQLGLPGGYVHSVLAYARMLMGHYKEARPLGQTALRIMQKNSDQRGIGWTCHVLGGIALGLAEFEEAEDLLRVSVDAYRPLGQRQELTFALSYLSYALWAQGRPAETKQNIAEVINIWNEIKSPQSLMFALVGTSLIWLDQNAPERAIELYALASTLSPCLENCHWFWDVAGRHIDDAVASLSPDVVAAAQARGRARDLQTTVVELLEMLKAS